MMMMKGILSFSLRHWCGSDFYGVECILKGGDLLVGFGEYAHQHGNIF